MSVISITDRLKLQKSIFESELDRISLLRYKNTSNNIKRIKVYRNHSFELIANTISVFLNYADLNVVFEYSDYDDSFSFFDFDNSVDSVLIWIDTDRYQKKENEIEEFLTDRIKDLRTRFTKPVLVAAIGRKLKCELPDVINIDCQSILSTIGGDCFNERLEPITGTRLSNNACLIMSKYLGLKYIPAALNPSLKAIFIDLDNTLYKGVLGEDGVNGIKITEAHRQLQSQLRELSKRLLVCVISKNEKSDVDKLFSENKEMMLSSSDITHIYASWQNKSEMVSQALSLLNISANAVLVIDDNVGELSEINSVYRDIQFIHASDNANITNNVLSFYPGLLAIISSKDDNLRKSDIQANVIRKELQTKLSTEDFLRQLKMQVRVLCNDVDGKNRIAQLSCKTNQFIFNYKRYSITDIENRLEDNNYLIVSLHLKDSLSDSGMIGVLVLKRESQDTSFLEECFISCRALGRGIDNLIVYEAINAGLEKLKTPRLRTNFTVGERNEPARRFYKSYLKKYERPTVFKNLSKSNLVTFVYR